MWQNDLVALNLWAKYYSKHFDKLFILCFNTKEKYIPELENLKQHYELDYEMVQEFEGKKVDGTPSVALNLVKWWQRKFVNEYKWVLFANVDEIVTPFKRLGTMRNLMKNSDKYLLPCTGYEVIQTRNEKPIDYSKPYFKQRKYWIRNPVYNKIIFSRIALEWNAGLHQIEGVSEDTSREFKNTGLYLIHLKHADIGAQNRDFGPYPNGGELHLDPNIMKHWRKKKRKIPEYIKKLL